MVKQTIQIFARIKPTKGKTGQYELSEDDSNPLVTFVVPKDTSSGVVNNKKERYKFKFERVFDQKTKQDEVFEHVARPVIDNVLEGYNGTIFAYGQTGSGKTFTITGGAEKFADRGIIPRTLSYIFDYYEQNSESVYTTHISYLEIYNENGYDLLDPKHEAAKLEDLPKVSLMEDSDQNIHLKNLSTHPANNEEDSLNLLFLGDTNRMIAETPMNQASTRSHCIFTIHITSREAGSATIRRSKLHLVDLAGSERVSKTGVNGVLLTEAKYINLSLHYLEQVIVALSEKTRQHIPYRNSMMTSVLRDSLGGNCMTTMIATMSVDKKNVDESISTARFAQRVALIKNDAILNEELDPKLMVLRLKREVQQLKEELAIATGEQRTDALTEEELERCQQAVRQYLEDRDPEATLNIGGDMRKIQECFRILKREVLEKKPSSAESSPSVATSAVMEGTPREFENPVYNTPEIKKLKELIRQRDNEINILVNMLKKEKKRAADAISRLEKMGHSVSRPTSAVSQTDELPNGNIRGQRSRNEVSNGRPPSGGRWNHERQERPTSEQEQKTQKKILGEMSMGRQEAFEIFRRDYEHNQQIDDNKHLLKQRYAEAKSLGEHVNQARNKINKLKSSIEQHRMSRVMQGLVDPENPEPDEMEHDMRHQIEEEKLRYKESFTRLRALKTEIEHLQHLLEKSKVQLMKDFEFWWAEQAAKAQDQQVPKSKTLRSAWRTPPATAESSQSSFVSDATSITSEANSQSRAPPVPGHVRQSLAGSRRASDSSAYGSQDSYSRPEPHKSRSSGDTRSRGGGGGPGGGGGGGAGSIPLTGDAQADADIMAFLRARQNIIKHTQSNQGHR